MFVLIVDPRFFRGGGALTLLANGTLSDKDYGHVISCPEQCLVLTSSVSLPDGAYRNVFL